MLQDVVEIEVERCVRNRLSKALAQVHEVVQALRQCPAKLGGQRVQVLAQPVGTVSHRQEFAGKSLHVVRKLVEQAATVARRRITRQLLLPDYLPCRCVV